MHAKNDQYDKSLLSLSIDANLLHYIVNIVCQKGATEHTNKQLELICGQADMVDLALTHSNLNDAIEFSDFALLCLIDGFSHLLALSETET